MLSLVILAASVFQMSCVKNRQTNGGENPSLATAVGVSNNQSVFAGEWTDFTLTVTNAVANMACTGVMRPDVLQQEARGKEKELPVTGASMSPGGRQVTSFGHRQRVSSGSETKTTQKAGHSSAPRSGLMGFSEFYLFTCLSFRCSEELYTLYVHCILPIVHMARPIRLHY